MEENLEAATAGDKGPKATASAEERPTEKKATRPKTRHVGKWWPCSESRARSNPQNTDQQPGFTPETKVPFGFLESHTSGLWDGTGRAGSVCARQKVRKPELLPFCCCASCPLYYSYEWIMRGKNPFVFQGTSHYLRKVFPSHKRRKKKHLENVGWQHMRLGSLDHNHQLSEASLAD